MHDDVLGPRGHVRDSTRRWLRNRFQEGPGFLFLATRGGRPLGPPAPHQDLAVVRQRARLVRVARADGIEAALTLGRCSRASLFRWLRAFEEGGLAALVPQRRGPRRPRTIHPAWLELVVITVRVLTYWNAKRISAELRRRGIASVSPAWIEALFDRQGVRRDGSLHRERGARYERARPNELWHIDIKGPFFIQIAGTQVLKTWIFGLVDDHARFLLGLRIERTHQAEPVLRWLRESIDLCGRPLALMTDNGSPFVVWMPGVLTKFGRTLQDLQIRHIRTQINSPWTNGKVERFWGTLQSELLDRRVFRTLEEAEGALGAYARYFNYHRLHGELDWLTPAERYDGTPFTDRGFEHVPALEHLQAWLEELRAAA